MAATLSIIDDTVRAPNLLWDTVWDGFVGDWAPAGIDASRKPIDIFAEPDIFALPDVFASPPPGGEASNNGGLRARAPLHTAILLCLMSDRRAEPHDVITDGSGDPRGWPGDAIDPSIAPLGSRLWQLRRRELTDATADLAVVFAHEALQTLVDQKAVTSIDVSAAVNLEAGRLELSVALYRQDGALAADMNFWLLWNTNGVHHPLAA
jgi:phage gp46-like protein